MSSSRAGNITGAIMLLFGIALTGLWGYVAVTQKTQLPIALLFVGVPVALFGAAIIEPKAFGDGAAQMKNVGSVVVDVLLKRGGPAQ